MHRKLDAGFGEGRRDTSDRLWASRAAFLTSPRPSSQWHHRRVVHLATRHPCGKQGVSQPHREEGPGELGLQGAGLGVGVRMDGWARLLGVGDGLFINERSPSSIPPLSRFPPAPPKLDFEASREKLQKLGEDDNSGSLSK